MADVYVYVNSDSYYDDQTLTTRLNFGMTNLRSQITALNTLRASVVTSSNAQLSDIDNQIAVLRASLAVGTGLGCV